MSDDLVVNKRMVRRSFEKAAASYDAAAVLQHEVGRRMLSRLDYIKHIPQAILDAGSGTGDVVPALRKRYPYAKLYALDIALAMLERARARVPWWQRFLKRQGVVAICGDLERLPLCDAAFGMVWSNLALQWVNEPQHVLSEVLRVLEPGGLFMFSTFGPDTLKELREAYRGTDRYTHVNRFIDMHDLGDMLVHDGFADPVMDMEYLTLTYDDVLKLMRDLKAIGAHNVTAGRRPGMTARSTLEAVKRNYEALRRDGKLPATFEVVYGHAWAPPLRRGPGGRRVIAIKPRS